MGITTNVGFVERSDQIFSSIFAAVEHLSPPEDRYLLLAELLGHPDQELVCVEANRRKNGLINSTLLDLEPMRRQLELVSHELNDLFADTSYAVASYWSPLDRQRRSIFRRWPPPAEQASRRLAAAVLFYASTFVGSPRRSPLAPMTSIIQYLSERAPNRPGLTIDFEDRASGHPDDVLPIPALAYSIWANAGVEELVDELARTRNLEELDTDLFAIIGGSREGPSTNTLEFAVRLRAACRRTASSLGEEATAYVEHIRETLNRLFGNSPEAALNRDQTVFFVVSSQLWRLAVGSADDTQFMHVFPTTVGNTCCILTMGTRGKINSIRRLELSHVARSAFVQPLLLDFRTNEKRSVENRNNNAFRRILGHNLPKILIQPGMNELVKMGRIVAGVPAEKGEALTTSIRNLQLIFEHYEGFLTSVMCSNKLEEQFDRDPSRFDVDSEIWEYVRLVYELRRSSHVSTELPRLMSLNLGVPVKLVLNGHKEFLREVLFIIISNAVEALNPLLVMRDPDRGLLSLKAWVDAPDGEERYLVIQIADRGGGFDPIKLAAFHAIQEQIGNAPHKDFWSAISQIIEERLPQAREGHLGIGLIFCLAYLRSLEWAPTICRAGNLEVATKPGYGTVVTLSIPGVQM